MIPKDVILIMWQLIKNLVIELQKQMLFFKLYQIHVIYYIYNIMFQTVRISNINPAFNLIMFPAGNPKHFPPQLFPCSGVQKTRDP